MEGKLTICDLSHSLLIIFGMAKDKTQKDKIQKDKSQVETINLDKVMSELREEMKRAVSKLEEEIKLVRTGRAHPSLLDGIKVFAYDSEIPINQLAVISVESPSSLIIQPYDPNIISSIEKAILQSGRDLVPSNDGKLIRIKIPPLTQENREKLIKLIRKKAEDFKVSIRNIRDKGRGKIKEAKDNKAISEDRMKKLLDEIQKMTNEHTSEIDRITQAKEKEILGQ